MPSLPVVSSHPAAMKSPGHPQESLKPPPPDRRSLNSVAMSTTIRDLILLFVACLVLLGPFLGKAVHIDDPLYIWAARQIIQHPLDFYGFTVNWAGHFQPMPEMMINPPLLPYYLALVGRVAGFAEFTLHTAMIPFTLLTLAGVYLLAGRYCHRPLLAAALLLVCPAFSVSSTTLMCDVPMLCAWIWALLIWTRFSQRSIAWYLPAGLLVAIAVLTKYSAVCLIPLLLAHMALYRAPLKTRVVQAMSLFVAVMIILAYNQYTRGMFGHGLIQNAMGFATGYSRSHGASAPKKMLDTLAYIGAGAMAMVLATVVTLPRWSRWILALMFPVCVVLVKISFTAPAGWSSPWPFLLQTAVLIWLGGVCVLACVVGVTIRKADADLIFLLLWIGGVFTFAAVFNWSINARSILPLVPPLCLLSQRSIGGVGRSFKPMLAGLGGGVLVSVLAISADYQVAAANRDLVADTTQQFRGRTIWFVGHWGFQYYMQLEGALPLDEQHPQCKTGDVVIVPVNNYASPPRGVLLQTIGSVSAGEPSWLSLLNAPLGANFYVSTGDRLPCIIGSVPAESALVFLVTGIRIEETPAGRAGGDGSPD